MVICMIAAAERFAAADRRAALLLSFAVEGIRALGWRPPTFDGVGRNLHRDSVGRIGSANRSYNITLSFVILRADDRGSIGIDNRAGSCVDLLDLIYGATDRAFGPDRSRGCMKAIVDGNVELKRFGVCVTLPDCSSKLNGDTKLRKNLNQQAGLTLNAHRAANGPAGFNAFLGSVRRWQTDVHWRTTPNKSAVARRLSVPASFNHNRLDISNCDSMDIPLNVWVVVAVDVPIRSWRRKIVIVTWRIQIRKRCGGSVRKTPWPTRQWLRRPDRITMPRGCRIGLRERWRRSDHRQ